MNKISELIEGPNSSLAKTYANAVRPEKPIDRFFALIQASRKEANLPPYTFPRLMKELKKLDKSKKNWSQDIYIANLLDSKNPPKFFFGELKKLKTNN